MLLDEAPCTVSLSVLSDVMSGQTSGLGNAHQSPASGAAGQTHTGCLHWCHMWALIQASLHILSVFIFVLIKKLHYEYLLWHVVIILVRVFLEG